MFPMIYLASQTWHLVSQGGMVDGPPPRHRHSAVLHNNALWVFGGMTDLQERSDFWRFDFGKYRLYTIPWNQWFITLPKEHSSKIIVYMFFSVSQMASCKVQAWARMLAFTLCSQIFKRNDVIWRRKRRADIKRDVEVSLW